MNQLSFEDLPKASGIYDGIAPHIVESFLKFHAENPQVYRLFKQYANALMSQGITTYGAKGIMERLRWHYEVESRAYDFKLNNNYASCFSRLLMSQDPSFKSFFSTRSHRELKAA